MDQFIQFLAIKCAKCKEPLIRLSQSKTNDKVVCPECLGVGSYKEVIEQGAGLVRGVLIKEETKDFIQQLRLRRENLL